MCMVNFPLAEAVRAIAEAEFRFEQVWCDATSAEKEFALTYLRRRGDKRAEQVLRDYLAQEQKAPLGLGE